MLTLLAKGVPFEVVNINLKSKPEWFLQQTWGTVSVVRYRKYLRIKIAKISDKLFFLQRFKGHFIMESLVNSDFLDEV